MLKKYFIVASESKPHPECLYKAIKDNPCLEVSENAGAMFEHLVEVHGVNPDLIYVTKPWAELPPEPIGQMMDGWQFIQDIEDDTK